VRSRPGPDGAPLLIREIREFFDQLVKLLPSFAYRRWFRLMLIHYPEQTMPSKWLPQVWQEDRTDAGDVQAEHVAEFLRFWWARGGVTEPEATVHEVAAEIVKKANVPTHEADQRCRLQRLHDLITEAIAEPSGRSG
jgi:hypothetical protein